MEEEWKMPVSTETETKTKKRRGAVSDARDIDTIQVLAKQEQEHALHRDGDEDPPPPPSSLGEIPETAVQANYHTGKSKVEAQFTYEE